METHSPSSPRLSLKITVLWTGFVSDESWSLWDERGGSMSHPQGTALKKPTQKATSEQTSAKDTLEARGMKIYWDKSHSQFPISLCKTPGCCGREDVQCCSAAMNLAWPHQLSFILKLSSHQRAGGIKLCQCFKFTVKWQDISRAGLQAQCRAPSVGLEEKLENPTVPPQKPPPPGLSEPGAIRTSPGMQAWARPGQQLSL